MKRRLRALSLTSLGCLSSVAITSLFACNGILGIPSDIGHDDDAVDGAPALPEASPLPDAFVPGDAFVPDAGRDAADASMAPDTSLPPECDLGKEFAAPVLLSSVSTTGDEGSPKLSEDELTIYFDALRAPSLYWDLYTATRATRTDSFGTATALGSGVNTPDNHEFAPNVSPNGLAIFFERKDPMSATFIDNFYVATRASTTLPWGTAVQIAGVNLPEYQGKLDVRGDGSELYFVKKGMGTLYRLYVAKRSGGNYSISQLVALNSPNEEYGSAVSKDGLVLYFASTRPAGAGMGGENIWVSARATTADDWGLPTLVGNVNSDADEEPSWLSTNGCRLYMVSTRSGGLGMQDIYVAMKPL